MFQVFAQGASSSASTASCPPELKTDFGCLPSDPIGFVERFYGIGLGFIGGVALLFMIVGGYYLLTSQGNPARVTTGKSFIFYSIAGLLLAIFGFVLIKFVAGDIIKIPGFN
jgi:hypothetical protein